jgi:hypothetical protein
MKYVLAPVAVLLAVAGGFATASAFAEATVAEGSFEPPHGDSAGRRAG